MNYGLYLLKVVHVFLNVCIWLFGGSCMGVGLWLLCDGDDFKYFKHGMDVQYIYTAATILVVVGILAMVWALIGCLGSSKESRCLMLVFIIGMVLTLIIEFVIAGIIWGNATNIKSWIKDQIQSKVANYYSESENNRRMIDFMQYYLNCCGAYSFRDYDTSKLPNSCKNSVTGIASSYGCLEYGEYFFERKAGLFGGMCLSLSLFQIFSLVVSLVIYCSFRRKN